MQLLLVIFYSLLVILPFTIGTAILRHKLYLEIKKIQVDVDSLIDPRTQNSSARSDLIRNLENRSREASLRSIEQADIAALLEQDWSNSKFRWEQKNRFCQVVPNLLLALGVLGTFLGLSSVLITLSGSINSASDFVTLKSNLQNALSGMGTAFFSSLFAILCSIVLTIFNLLWNTNLAKNRLFTSLEYYINNVYLPRKVSQENFYLHSEFDRIIVPMDNLSRVVQSSFDNLSEDFLNSFTYSIRDAVISSFGEKIEEITKLHLTFHQETRQEIQILIDQASQVYAKFGESSTLLFAGANRLKESAEESAKVLESSSNQFRKNIDHASNSLKDSISVLQRIFEYLDGNTSRLQQATGEIANAIESSMTSLQQTVEISTKALGTSTENFQQMSTQAIKHSIQFSEQMSAASSELSQSVSRLDRSAQSSEETLVLLQSLGQEQVLLAAGIRNFSQNVEQALTSVNNSQRALTDTTTELRDQRKAFKGLLDNLSNLRNQVSEFTQGNNQFLERIRAIVSRIF